MRVLAGTTPVPGSPGSGMGVSTYYLGVNRNKRSIALDLRDADDRAAARELARRADVFIENFKPGGLARFGLDYEATSADNPGVVYASISGFGSGPEGAALPGYDLIVQAISGLMSVTGDPAGEPFRAGVAVFDVISGLHATIGILAALNRRHETGRGQHVEVSLLASAMSGLVNQTSAYVAGGVVPFRMGNSHPSLFPDEPLRCADGELIITAGNVSFVHEGNPVTFRVLDVNLICGECRGLVQVVDEVELVTLARSRRTALSTSRLVQVFREV